MHAWSAMFPSSRARQAVLVALGLALATTGCAGDAPDDQQVAPEEVASSQPGDIAPVQSADASALAALGRADLIAAFARASDAVAAGQPLADANRQLVGRMFSVKLPFGCGGEANNERSEWAAWTFDRNRQTLKLIASPERWADADWVKTISGGMPHEAVEGFWIDRPWTSSDACPDGNTAAYADLAGSDERQTFGIAQFFAPDSPRTFQRGGRPYSHTIRVDDATEMEGRSYHLAVSGRVAAFPDGQPIHCVADFPDRRPVCLMAVELARVSFEDPRDGSVLVEWRN